MKRSKKQQRGSTAVRATIDYSRKKDFVKVPKHAHEMFLTDGRRVLIHDCGVTVEKKPDFLSIADLQELVICVKAFGKRRD